MSWNSKAVTKYNMHIVKKMLHVQIVSVLVKWKQVEYVYDLYFIPRNIVKNFGLKPLEIPYVKSWRW